MPSKSKAQAHLMAAAAHNPEIAKDAGIPQSVAKDFNQADKKEGTLKKGSKKPEHVNEEVINEASGVGVLKVPPTLLKQVQRLVGSVVFTMALMRQNELAKEGETEEAQALNTFLKRYQNRYNVSKLSAADLKKYVNSITTVPIDKNAIFNELPDSLKKKPGVKEAIDKMVIRLLLSNQVQGINGSSDAPKGRAMNIQTLKIPRYQEMRYASNIVDILNQVVGTVEHELQHAIQQSVIYSINHNNSQLEVKPDYAGADGKTYGDAYYASGIEFGTQTKDLINYAKKWLDENPDEITGNKNHDISNAVKFALNSYKGVIVQALRNFKHNDRANKVMKLIYKAVSEYYENEYADQSDSGEVDKSEQDVFGDTSGDYYRMLDYPEAGDSLLGDLWLSINRYFDEKPSVYGNYDDIQRMVFRRPYGEIEFEPAQNGGIHMYVRAENRDQSYHMELDPKESKQLVSDVAYFTNLQTVHKLKEKIEHNKIPNVNLENAYHELESIKETESMFNSDRNKKINIEFDDQDMNIWISFNGARELMYVQEGGKNYYFGYGNNYSECKSNDFKKSFEELFKFYYDPETNQKMINKMLKHVSSQPLTPDEIESYSNYLKDLYAQEEVTESSMRGWVDVIQNAELEHNIDDADEQELIHKGQLEEMPQRFDAFAGQDPNDFVDRTAKMNNQSNMVPVSDHGNFKVLKSKNGTGYIAYDQNNKPIAIVSGYSSGGVFHEEAIASKSNNKGVVYQIYMDILNDGQQILSDTLHSDDAIRFWQKLISNHEVYIVGDGKVLAKATPEKFHKYWGEEDSPSAELQLLLVK